MKTCRKCHTDQPLENFGRDPTRPDGLQRNCRTCMNAYAKARYASMRQKLDLYERAKKLVIEKRMAQATQRQDE